MTEALYIGRTVCAATIVTTNTFLAASRVLDAIEDTGAVDSLLRKFKIR